MKQSVEICSSCIVSQSSVEGENTFVIKQKFLDLTRQELKQQRPDVAWDVSTTSCQRLCPNGRITFVMDRRLELSSGVSVENVVTDIVARIKP